MRHILIISLFFAALVAQTSLAPLIAILGAEPSPILAFVLAFVFFQSFSGAWPYLVLVSVVTDFLASTPFGLASLSILISSYLVDQLAARVFSSGQFWYNATILSGLGVLSYYLARAGLAGILGLEGFFSFSDLAVFWGYNLLFVLTVFYAIKKILHRPSA